MKLNNTFLQEALLRGYYGTIFDIDGTLTERGVHEIPAFVLDSLIDLTDKVPVAFCTARWIHSIKKLLLPFFERVYDLSRVIIMAENGGMGYIYNKKNSCWENFFRAGWPENIVPREKALKLLKDQLLNKDCSVVEGREIIFSLYPDRGLKDKQELARRTALIAEKTEIILDSFKGHRDVLRVYDSGVGVHVVPVESDKDRGIFEFGLFLRQNYNVAFSTDAMREILVVGDQPYQGGNDHIFLDGKYGTPFTVGRYDQKKDWPLPVISSGIMKSGPEATYELLQKLNFEKI